MPVKNKFIPKAKKTVLKKNVRPRVSPIKSKKSPAKPKITSFLKKAGIGLAGLVGVGVIGSVAYITMKINKEKKSMNIEKAKEILGIKSETFPKKYYEIKTATDQTLKDLDINLRLNNISRQKYSDDKIKIFAAREFLSDILFNPNSIIMKFSGTDKAFLILDKEFSNLNAKDRRDKFRKLSRELHPDRQDYEDNVKKHGFSFTDLSSYLGY